MNPDGPGLVGTPLYTTHSISSLHTTKMTDMISISRASLEQIYKTIGSHLGTEVAAALAKTTKVSKAAAKAEKKPRANAGQSTAWAAFSSKIQADHKAEVDAVKADAAAKRKAAKEAGLAAPEDTQGAHLHWCSRYKAEHEAEWLAFKAAWEVEHPKSSRATSAAASVVDDAASVAPSVASGDAAPKKRRGAKKDSECTPAELAERKAKRAAAKAKKAAATTAPDAEAASAEDEVEEEAAVEVTLEESGSVEVETEDTLIPWTSPKGTAYLRVGHLDAEGDGVWNEGNWLWAVKEDGSRGTFAGVLLASGKIDTKAEEPELE